MGTGDILYYLGISFILFCVCVCVCDGGVGGGEEGDQWHYKTSSSNSNIE